MVSAMGDRSWDECWLGATGVDDPEVAAEKLRSIRRLVLLTVALEAWLALRYVPYSSSPGIYGLAAAGLGVCAIAGWHDRFARPAMGVALLLLLAVVLSVFPENANHQYLSLLLLTIALLVDPHGSEAESDTVAALQSMRWIVAIGIFWAGVMKLYYGYWLGGEFLAFRVANDPDFRTVLGFLVPAPELARLMGLGTEIGAGPYRAAAPLLIAVSNVTWLSEVVLPFFLLWSRTRGPAMVATILLFLAIQAGAREVFFGGLMVGLLLLYARRDRVAGALPWIVGVYVFWLLRPEWLRWVEGGQGG
jgi:hypothetical protein